MYLKLVYQNSVETYSSC